MGNAFIDGMKEASAEQSVSITENGALGYKNTSSKLVDFFFRVGSMRNMDADCIKSMFSEAFIENEARALELLFLVRDCRGGQGEKRTFDICFDWLIGHKPTVAAKLLPLIPEYGSWKTFFGLTDSFKKNDTVLATAKAIVSSQWANDTVETKKSISLMGKWMPSCNTSSKQTRQLGTYWREFLGLDERSFRKSLTALRKRIGVVESLISRNNWNKVDYNKVPGIAGVKYAEAFFKHDAERYRAWKNDVAEGKNNAKINVGGLTAPNLAHSVRCCFEDAETSELAWKALIAKAIPGSGNLIPVVDGSGSMFCGIGGTCKGTQAIDVSQGLGLYLSAILPEPWKGWLIEFGSDPNFFQVSQDLSLKDQLEICSRHDDCGSTDLEKVFNLVLATAVKRQLKQEEIPNLVIFSDMEFNVACQRPNERLMSSIAKDFALHGYKLPKLFFWNINSRSGTIPMLENELGVGLISGFNQSIMDMVMSNKLNPYDILIEKLDSARYNPVRRVLA